MKAVTIEQAITACDELKPNSYSTAQKKKWLNEIDGLVWDEIFTTHEDCPRYYNVILNPIIYRRILGYEQLPENPQDGDKAVFNDDFYIYSATDSEWQKQGNAVIVDSGWTDYDDNDEGDTELLVPTPYDSLYTYYLHMQIDKANNDQRYDNSAMSFSNAYNSFSAYYNRTHLPLQKHQYFNFLRRR